jgi:putative N6-adenine-specific DNA methylase
MDLYSQDARILITCTKRLTPFVAEEVTSLGYTLQHSLKSAIELKGTLADCVHLNLNLRTASQVLYQLKGFKIGGIEDLYRSVYDFPWEKVLSKTPYFSITSNVHHPSINNNLFVNVKVKDAIADRLRNKNGKRPDSGPQLDHAVIHLYWSGDFAQLFIDTSGETLAKHGYRKIPGKAPMLESLAAATLLATRWTGTSPFVNPMCGSGTVAIEAALLASRRMPGLIRSNYSFMHIDGYKPDVYETERKQLEARIKHEGLPPILASDISADAIQISKINARAAGVESLITFSQCDFRDTNLPAEPGIIYFNPEYGERLGDAQELEFTYSSIGDYMKQKCQGYRGYIFTGNLDLAKKVRLKARRRIEFYSGQLDCRLLEFELYAGKKEPD